MEQKSRLGSARPTRLPWTRWCPWSTRPLHLWILLLLPLTPAPCLAQADGDDAGFESLREKLGELDSSAAEGLARAPEPAREESEAALEADLDEQDIDVEIDSDGEAGEVKRCQELGRLPPQLGVRPPVYDAEQGLVSPPVRLQAPLGPAMAALRGPAYRPEVAAVDLRLDPALQVGWSWARPLVRLFEGMLEWTYRHLVPNYGVAIILLTILLRLVTYPLTQKSMKSMRRFSEIAPEMKVIQQKHKDDKSRQQQEMMALYQRKGINPFAAMGGGCLPMLIQFPFLIALYFALQGSIELRHAPFFGWIRDLSAPEQLFDIAGVPIRLLPLMMGATMVLQQRLSPSAGMDPQQRQMMMWMSVMFIFLFYQFPSGLVLYWFVSNLLGIAQQFWVNRQGGPAGARPASQK